jgi:GNAT superfamily N-acetyltransferase
LWTRVWRRPKTHVADALLDYFDTVYFRNPWVDSGIHSLVHLAEDGTIDGFAGLIPRPFLLGGEPLFAAVSSGVIVHPSAQGRGIAATLKKHIFDGPQDFNFTDGASYLGSKVWASCGGQPARLYSRQWRKTLLPLSRLLARAKPRIGLVAELVRPIVLLLDLAITRLPIGAYRTNDVNVVDVQVETAAEILELRELSEPESGLHAVYDQESFDWLLSETSKAEARGQLQKIIVKNQSGIPLGWYVYFARHRGNADVMQIGAHPDHVDEVLDSLILRAKRDGSVELSGQFDPRFAHALLKAGCRITSNHCFWIHSRNPKILSAIDSGRTSLSRLDGEWWLRFSDGPW